mgnify:CR=1 FL=1
MNSIFRKNNLIYFLVLLAVITGFIIIDDYLTCYGSKKAVDEFRKKRKINSKMNLDGRGGIWFQKN